MFARGDLVRHQTMPGWGIGKVIRVVQGGNLLVSFSDSGKKILSPKYPHLEKIPEDDLLYLVVRETRRIKGRLTPCIRFIPIVKPSRGPE
jgi:hypothetical protein